MLSLFWTDVSALGWLVFFLVFKARIMEFEPDGILHKALSLSLYFVGGVIIDLKDLMKSNKFLLHFVAATSPSSFVLKLNYVSWEEQERFLSIFSQLVQLLLLQHLMGLFQFFLYFYQRLLMRARFFWKELML